MSVVRSTFDLYRRAAITAGNAFRRSPVALLGLVGGQIFVMALGGMAVSTLGPVGGLVAAFFSSAFFGSYLYLLEQALSDPQGVSADALQESLGKYLREVMSVAFVLFLISLAVSIFGPIAGVLSLAVFVVANPVPEVIYNQRRLSCSGLDTLGAAVDFLKENWLEWFLPQIALGALLVGTGFGFAIGGGLVAALLDIPGGAIVALVLGLLGPVMLLHYTMLFRGALFRELSGSSRRSRAWRARMAQE